MICKRSAKDITYTTLIETGIKLFGAYGYNAVSIRQISKDAKANIAAVCYYFGSKKKFYEAVVRFLTDEIITFLSKFDLPKFEEMPVATARATLAEFISQYQEIFISEHGVNRLNIFMHEAFGDGESEAGNIYTETMKYIHNFFSRVLGIYFTKAGKNLEQIEFSLALIHGIIQTYVITHKKISPAEIKFDKNILRHSIEVIIN